MINYSSANIVITTKVYGNVRVAYGNGQLLYDA